MATSVTKPTTCLRCDAVIPVPKGWSRGPAIRRHYWRKHPDVMRPFVSKGGGRNG